MTKTLSLKSILLLFFDVAAILAAWGTAGWARVLFSDFFERNFSPHHLTQLMPSIFVTVPILILSMAATGLYRFPREMAPGYLVRLFNSATLGIMVLIAGMFFFTRKMYSRSLMGMFWVSLIAFIILGRWSALKLLRLLKTKGLGAERVAIIGRDQQARALAQKLQHRKEARFRFSGFIHPFEPGVEPADHMSPYLGVTDDLMKIIKRKGIDRIIIAEPNLPRANLVKIAGTCNRMRVMLQLVPDAMGFLSSMEVTVSELGGTPLIVFRSVGFSRWEELVKRSLDLAGSVILTALLLPLCALIAAAIRLDSRGPVLFRQRRIGKGGKSFEIYKFRTMCLEAEESRKNMVGTNEADGYIFKMEKDPRVTRIGGFLRRWSLDELPQLINVFRGEMSLVGPRPLPMGDLPEEAGSDPYQFWLESRERVMPGITGLWQIRGRSELSFQDMVRLDMYYIENWSPKLDVEILLRTVPVVLLGRGAY